MNRNDRLPTVAPARKWLLPLAFSAVGIATLASAQTPAKPTPAKEKPAPTQAEAVSGTALPEVVVSEPKLGGSLLQLPLSATVAGGDFIDATATRTPKDAAIYSPNTFFTEFSARKLSSPRIRGLGASPANQGVTTYIDGVPQIHGNTTSQELLDIEQLDIVRGPAGALFGRNSVGGLVNVTSRRPSLDTWGGEFESTFGNYNLFDYRGRVTGPLIQDELGFSFAGGYTERDGYTKDALTGNDIDNRSSYFGKTQFLWTPDEKLEVRFILSGESSQDGDYSLNDLGALRRKDHSSARNTQGSVSRDILSPTLLITYHADNFDFTSVTGYVWWKTQDITDLDYTPAAIPSIVRRNDEHGQSFTQEFRFSNPVDRPIELSPTVKLTWQAGLFYFSSNYEQDATSYFSVGAPITLLRVTEADLEDWGLGAYGQATLTFFDRLSITAGLRADYEHKNADIFVRNDFVAPFAPNTEGDAEFSQVSPQAAISYSITPDVLAYFSFAGGYKAGGYNAVTVAGLPATYDEERSWNYELGVKGRAFNNKLNYSAAFFYTDWQDLQLNVPNATPADYYITNAGSASSKGIELAASYRPVAGWDLFAAAGWQDAKFGAGTTDGPANISGNKVPYTPDYTVTVGTQVTWDVGHGYSVYARGDVQFIGAFDYDSINGAGGQSAYSLANFRLGVRNQTWFIEGFVNNAFDTNYEPIAIPFPGIAPSGYIGESGAPLTAGVRVGVKF